MIVSTSRTVWFQSKISSRQSSLACSFLSRCTCAPDCKFCNMNKNMNCGIQLDAILTGFSMAVDRIDHDTLLWKLAEVGVHENLLRCSSFYINNTTQTVIIGMCGSKFVSIIPGVPHVSNLSPLLFNIYIIDFSTGFLNSNS